MNKRKLLTLATTLCMVAILAIGGTLAYFTDTDGAKNVMTTGNVDIQQKESERVIAEDGSTQLTKFTNDKPLYPAVFYDKDGNVIAPNPSTIGKASAPTWSTVEIEEVNGDTDLSKKLLDKGIANEVDKIVQVTNTGSRPVYARTVFLMENANLDNGKQLSDYVIKYWTENGNQNSGYYNKLSGGELKAGNNITLDLITIGNETYSAYVYYYDIELQPGEITAASLKQIYLDPNADNDISAVIGDEYVILALSQAVQTDGFTDDRDALNAAFGEVTAANCKDWFADLAK